MVRAGGMHDVCVTDKHCKRIFWGADSSASIAKGDLVCTHGKRVECCILYGLEFCWVALVLVWFV